VLPSFLLLFFFSQNHEFGHICSRKNKGEESNLDVSQALKVGGEASLKGAVKADSNLYVGSSLYVDKNTFLIGDLSVP
jgi:cytoskeletal protein CcmA (bactofilin family)